MVKSKVLDKGQILFTCSNDVTAIYMKAFSQIKVFYRDKHIVTYEDADKITARELCLRLESCSIN